MNGLNLQSPPKTANSEISTPGRNRSTTHRAAGSLLTTGALLLVVSSFVESYQVATDFDKAALGHMMRKVTSIT